MSQEFVTTVGQFRSELEDYFGYRVLAWSRRLKPNIPHRPGVRYSL